MAESASTNIGNVMTRKTVGTAQTNSDVVSANLHTIIAAFSAEPVDYCRSHKGIFGRTVDSIGSTFYSKLK